MPQVRCIHINLWDSAPSEKNNEMKGVETGENSQTRFWPKPSESLANQRAGIEILSLWAGCDGCDKILNNSVDLFHRF
jgi:hypothetical protein